MVSATRKETMGSSKLNALDFDTEDIEPDYEPSESDIAEDANAGREHYVEMSKSGLKSANTALKDSKYRGKSANRKDLFPNLSDIDAASDKESVEVSVDEDSEDGREFDESENEISEEHINDSGEFSEGSEVEPEEDEDMEQSRRDKVRELLSQETKSVAQQLADSVQMEAEKGRDIKGQQRFYETLLDTRIRLQSALVALNSLPQGDNVERHRNSDTVNAINDAKDQAYAVLRQTFDLRKGLLPQSNQESEVRLKRKFAETSLSEVTEVIETFNTEFGPWRDEILTKWSDKVKAASGLPINKTFKALNQSITHQLAENLRDRERLIERTRTKRATFTVLGKSDLEDDRRETIDHDIFDDIDFYYPLIKDLVEKKALDIPVASWNIQTKVKKNVKHTRASKGRKLRYQEHEKLLNFMAPLETGTWHEEQIDELFASLLGRRIPVDEDVLEPEETVDTSDGLRIFG